MNKIFYIIGAVLLYLFFKKKNKKYTPKSYAKSYKKKALKRRLYNGSKGRINRSKMSRGEQQIWN